MKNNNTLWEIVIEIYRELYKQAEPPVDFDTIWKMAGDIEFYSYFYLDSDKQDKIMEKIMKEHRCTKREKDIIRTEVLLGASPANHKNKGGNYDTKRNART